MLNITELTSQLGAYSQDPTVKKDIITRMMYNPDITNRIGILPGVTDEIPLPNALISDPLAPLADAANVQYKGNVVKLDAEILKVQECILAVKITPTKFWNTYLSTLEAVNIQRKQEAKKTGVPADPFVMPFHEFFMEKLAEQAQASMYAKALFQGVRNSGGSSSSDLFDGFLKKADDAITATDLTETITGAIDASNVLAKLYELNDALGEESKNNVLNAHLPGKIFDMLTRTFNPAINTSVVATQDLTSQLGGRVNAVHVPGTNITAYREPGMGDTNRVMVTEANNLFLGYSVNPKDIEFEIQRRDLSLHVLLYFRAGTAIGKLKDDFGALAINDEPSTE